MTGQGRNGFKLKEGRLRLDLGKKLLPVRAARRRHRLPRAAAGAPALAVPKARLDGAGSSRGWGEGSLPTAGAAAGCSVWSLPTQTALWFYAFCMLLPGTTLRFLQASPQRGEKLASEAVGHPRGVP